MSSSAHSLIRLAEQRDIDVLPAIEAAALALFPPGALPPGTGRPMPRDELAAAQAAGLLWVACIDEAAIGFLAGETHAACLHIVEMDVTPAHGRRGVGSQLLRAACDAAAHRGLQWITLTTFDHLPWNAPFYRRHGFEATDDLDRFAHLRSALQGERSRGLENRVAMVRPAAAQANAAVKASPP